MEAENVCQCPGGVGQKRIQGSLRKSSECCVVRSKNGEGGPFPGAVEGGGKLSCVQGGNEGAEILTGGRHGYEGLRLRWEKDSSHDVDYAVAGFDINLLKGFSTDGKSCSRTRILGERKSQAKDCFDGSGLNERGAVLRPADEVVFQDLAEESAVVLDGFEGFLAKSLECGIGRSKDREVEVAAAENPRETGLFHKRGKD